MPTILVYVVYGLLNVERALSIEIVKCESIFDRLYLMLNSLVLSISME